MFLFVVYSLVRFRVSDSTTVSTGNVSKIKEGWFNRNEILRMNALDNAEMTEQEKDALCQSLIDQSHQEFDYEVQTAENPNKLLTKIFYRKAVGLRQRDLNNQIFFVADEHDRGELWTTGAAIAAIAFGVDQN